MEIELERASTLDHLEFVAGGARRHVVDDPPRREAFPQNQSRIEKNGLSNVSGLAKDDSGVWRGKAMKDGQQVDVSLDYQGNVVTR